MHSIGSQKAKMRPFGSLVTSVQQFSISLASGGATTGTATINRVDTSQAVIFYNGLTRNTGTAWSGGIARLSLTDATTITATRNSGSTSNNVTYGTVVEFNKRLVQRVQYGTVTLTGATSNTATITSIDTTNSVVLWLGSETTATGFNFNQAFTSVEITNSTTITGRVGSSAFNNVIGFVVVEFHPNVIRRIQARSPAITGTNLSDTDTLTNAVVTANTWLAYGGMYSNNTGMTASISTLQLTSSTQVTVQRGLGTSMTRNIRYAAVEFVPGVLTGNLNGAAAINAGNLTENKTIAFTNPKNSFVSYEGCRAGTATTSSTIFCAGYLGGVSTITAARGGSANSTNYGYNILWFAP